MLRSTLQAARFWGLDFWGREWDWQRRRLLFSHYAAYLRNGAIPEEYVPEVLNFDPGGLQESFASQYRRRIEQVQLGEDAGEGVFLTYRPLGKNLRLLGTALRKAIDRNRHLFIQPGAPGVEERALGSRGFGWSPWLWVRRNGTGEGTPADAALAWNELFQHPAAKGAPGRMAAVDRLPSLKIGAGPFGPRLLETVLKLATATRYVFTPAPDITTQIRALRQAAGWPDGEPVLGIHVRRGDAASAEAVPQAATRRSFPLATYLETADRLCTRYGIRHIFLGTESPEEIQRAKALRPQYRFLWVDYDRSILPRIGATRQFIEDYALENPGVAKALATTAILDLSLFCDCDAFVGAFNSEFSVLAWLLMVGSRERLVPHVSLSRSARGRSLNPFAALLNLRNNCPLELYHW